jgi:hypothetical protein
MAINTTKLLSGRAQVVGYGNLTADRYQFLSLGQAEPNLGPGNANSILTLSTSNTRVWSNSITLNSITVSGNVSLDNISISNTTLTTLNANLVTIGGNAGFVIPAGGNSQRPASPLLGTTRFSIPRDCLETWDGSTWIAATGGGGGNIITPGSVADQQITPDGTSTTYTLIQSTLTNNILVWINGVGQTPGTAYNVSGNLLTFATAPLTTDNIDIRFISYAVSLSSMSNQSGNTSITIVPPGNAASNIVFTTANTIVATMTSNIFNINFPVSVIGNVTANAFVGNLSGYAANSIYANSAGTAGTVTANAQANITSVGILSNLSVSGNIQSANINATGVISAAGNIRGGNIISTGTISVLGNVTAGNFIGNGALISSINGANVTGVVPLATYAVTANSAAYAGVVTTNAQPNITSLGTLNSLSVVGNILSSGVISATGNLYGNYILGNGALLTGVVTSVANINNGNSNISISANANITVSVAGVSNIVVFATSGEYINGVASVSGNVTGGNILTAGQVSAAGNLYGTNLSVTGVTTVSGNITGGNLLTTGIISAGGNATFGNISAFSQIGNTISITGSVTATGYIGNGNTLSNIQGANVNGAVTVANTAGTVTTNAQPNITSVGTLTSLTVSGNISGSGSGLTNIPAANISGNITFATTAGTVTANTQPTITKVGNLTTLNVDSYTTSLGYIMEPWNLGAYSLPTFGGGSNASGRTLLGWNRGNNGEFDIIVNSGGNSVGGISFYNWANTAANVSTPIFNVQGTTGDVTVYGNIINGGANVTGNIGSSTNYFNRLFANSTSAIHSDLAEMYLADNIYPPGTVLSFGGSAELTLSRGDSDPRVAGVVSTKPAYQMNSGLTGEFVTPLALTGRVPCLVQGNVSAGSMMVSAGNGRARAEQNPAMGTVIGKALTSFTGDLGIIEVVVGRM